MYRQRTSIKIKHGCEDCPAGNQKPVYARKKCWYHYQVLAVKRRNEKNKTKEDKIEKDELWEWYEDRIRECGLRCENCGQRIYPTLKNRHYFIAHIFPKKAFPSVAKHPLNWIELGVYCGCHADYDNLGLDYGVNMMCWSKMVERFLQFDGCLTHQEKAKKFYSLFKRYASENR